MQLTLTPFREIQGVGPASGICLHDGRIYLVSDNATFLYAYSLLDDALVSLPMKEDAGRDIPKKEKPDLESLLLRGHLLEAYGSGSLPNRQAKVVFDLKSGAMTWEDLSDLYEKMRAVAAIEPDEFNIEGVVAYKQCLLFFQRGNGVGGYNGLFTVSGSDITYLPVRLPAIKGVDATFTDAVVVNDTLYFLASAEASSSTFLDGTVTGSLLGTLDPETGTPTILGILPGEHKFEGIAFEAQTDDFLSFLLCEDNDGHSRSTTLYRLVISG